MLFNINFLDPKPKYKIGDYVILFDDTYCITSVTPRIASSRARENDFVYCGRRVKDGAIRCDMPQASLKPDKNSIFKDIH